VQYPGKVMATVFWDVNGVILVAAAYQKTLKSSRRLFGARDRDY
jgi:hypothetical protein